MTEPKRKTQTQKRDTKKRGERWFDCSYCDTTFAEEDLSKIRQRGARHLNEEHGDQLSRKYERVETQKRGGDHIHDNIYQIKQIDIYLTKFDLLAPIRKDGHLFPSQVDSVCDECGARVTHDNDLEKVEKEPDTMLNEDWVCSACVEEAEIKQNIEENAQLTEFTP